MKIQIVVMTAIATLIAPGAFADGDVQRPVTQIDFNNLIDEGNTKTDRLNKDLAAQTEQSLVENKSFKLEQQKVLKFVDVEVGLTEERPVVSERPNIDRRVNSIGAARLVH